jgi:hypothetical protein
LGRLLGALVALALVAAAVVAVVSVVLVVLARTGALIGRRRPVTVTCIQCGGRGWIAVPERTLHFDGTAFVDNPTCTAICTACRGVGTVMRG